MAIFASADLMQDYKVRFNKQYACCFGAQYPESAMIFTGVDEYEGLNLFFSIP